MRLRVRPDAPDARDAVFPHVAAVRKHNKVGAEKVAGYQTGIYVVTREVTRPDGQKVRVTHRYWLAPNLPAPVKIVNSSPDGTSSITIVLKSADLKTPVPDSLFVVPKEDAVREAPLPAGNLRGSGARPRAGEGGAARLLGNGV